MSKNDAEEQKADISNLQENFSKQQKKISALKELVRKSEVAHDKSTSSAQEKVKNIAKRLTHLKSKARSRLSLDEPQQDVATEAAATSLASANSNEHLQISLSQTITTPSSSAFTTPNPTPLKLNQRSESSTSLATASSTPGGEKILLMRQQMEQNKLRMAQRASSKQHLEQLVTQLKEKFDTTQQCLEDTSSELGKSMTDLSALAYTPVSRERHKSATDLASQPFNLERERMKFLENRCRLLEKQLEKERHNSSLHESVASQATSKRTKELENKILELEETLRDKHLLTSADNELELENERLKNELLEQQTLISNLEAFNLGAATHEVAAYEADELSTENERLKKDIGEKLKRIDDLESINDMLESTRCELTIKNNEFEERVQELMENLKLAENTLLETQQRLMESTSKCVELQQTLETLQNSTEAVVVVEEKHKDTNTQIKAEMAKQIQELQDETLQLKEQNSALQQRLIDTEKIEVSDITIAEKIDALQATIESQRDDLQTRLEATNKYEEELMEKTIELNVLNANFKVLEEKLQTTNKNKPLFSATAEETSAQNPELQAEVQQLKQKLDEANKAMIKLKLKCKQTEKQMEKLKKTTDLHTEIVKLEKEKEELQQKITELEDEKGQWQLQQVGTDASYSAVVQLNSKQAELEEKCQVQTETIRLLEEQKYEYAEKLETAQTELQVLKKHVSLKDKEETDRVVSEMSEIHLEEQLADQSKSLCTLQTKLADSEAKVVDLKCMLEALQVEKQAIDKKLEHYLSENMELLDKVDKLSKSSSSAESIEIVERLTQQERAEIDAYNKRLDQELANEEEAHAREDKELHTTVSEITQTSSSTEMGQELNDSLIKLREESSELMNKIELFTTERREVLEKMEHLTAENHELFKKIEELNEEKEELETNALLSENAKTQLEARLQDLVKEKELLASQVAESSAHKSKLSQELTSLQHSSEVVASLEGADGITLFDKCEKSLCKLNSELEAYRKANDKNAKFTASKKLAKEAKNAYMQLSELLQKVKEASTAVETVTVVETVVAVTAPNGKALAEYEQLTAQNRELKATVEELKHELQEALEEDQSVPSVQFTEVPAITQEKDTLEIEEKTIEFEQKIADYEEQCTELQSTVEDLRLQLQEARLAGEEKTDELTRLNEELEGLRKMSEDFDHLLNDKEMSYEKQVEQMTRLRRELEAKCETYEGEMEILQTLITEQKQQLIEAYKENEHEVNLKLLDLQQRDEEITELRGEIKQLQATSLAMGAEFADNLQKECNKLRETLKINKNLVAEQLNELANKQETIDTLNQQIIDLYKTMEENANNVIEKEDEIVYLQELLERNTKQMETLHKDNDQQKAVVDKILGELHSHRTNAQQLPQLEAEVQRLEHVNKELAETNKALEQRNKDQLEKLKKYAANLKKRTTQCQEYETKVKEFEKSTLEATETKESADDLQEIMANNILLNERINILETKLKEIECESAEIKEAIQAKTMELLESLENNARLENELRVSQCNVSQNMQEVMQLQNALAASSRDQMSDWNNDTLDALNVESQELVTKTAALECAEQTLNDVQNELLQMQEQEKTRGVAAQELQRELKEKTQLVEQLQAQLATACADKHLRQQLDDKAQQLSAVSEELKAKSLKFEKSKAVIKERNNHIHRLQAELRDLQSKLVAQPEEEPLSIAAMQTPLAAMPADAHITSEAAHESLKQAYEQLNDKYQTERSNFQETIERLETLHDGIQAKLQEDMSYIESLEQEIAKYKDKICKLEECVGIFEERRASMERRANFVDAQMQIRADEYEKSEDALVYRLNMLSDHDDVIGQRLLDTQEEKEELQDRLQQLHVEINALTAKYTKLEKEYEAYKEDTNSNLEADNTTLKEKLVAIELEVQRQRSVYDAKLAAKSTEIDELECDLSDQLEKIHTEKRTLTESLERARDECTEQKDEVVRLKETLNMLEQSRNELERESGWLRMQHENAQQDQYELQELRMQTMQDKTEIENLRHQIESLAANHDIELQGLRTQISELDTLRMQVGQNQTDDQVFIETENKRLTDLLAEKETLIENYQRQNLQLQMAAVAAAAQPQQLQQDPFALAFGLPTAMQTVGTEDRDRLERDLAEKTELASRLQRDLNVLQAEMQCLHEGNTEMKRQLGDKQRDLDNMLRMHQQRAHAQHQSGSDVIPAPVFFATDQMTPSPFDDIVHARSVDTHNLEGGANSRASIEHPIDLSVEQPTIEDLQRNVSDLEKHAQDLENKLMLRNQRDGELEERLREAEQRIQERDVELQYLKQVEEQHKLLQSETDYALMDLEQKLKAAYIDGEEQLKLITEQRNAERMHENQISDQIQKAAVERMAELQTNLEKLQTLLQERDEQLQQLQRTLADESHLRANEKMLEDQILPADKQFDAALAAAGPTLDMFFGGSTAPEFENLIKPQLVTSDEPVIEEVIVPKKAYVCHPVEKQVQLPAVTALDLGDDDWGDSWSGNEAVAEAAHFAATANQPARSLVSREQQLEIQLQEQQERIQELELAQERCEQQKQELQIKSGKLMKKLKEYKTKIDELQAIGFRKSTSVESNSMFGDLDAAIQEELKAQLTQLETKLEEQRKQQENQVAEKEKLLKRIDVLTAGNERMSEMKERQDMDVQMYQARIRELQDKMKRLEDWGGADSNELVPAIESVRANKAEATHVENAHKRDEEFVSLREEVDDKIKALTAEIQDINGDRQEIQALLDEERSNAQRAEETARSLQLQVTVLENAASLGEHEQKSRYNELKLDFQNLQDRSNNLQDCCNSLQAENSKLSLEMDVLRKECEVKTQNVLELQTEVASLTQRNQELLDRAQQPQLITELEQRLHEQQTQNEQLKFLLQAGEQQMNEEQSELLQLRTRSEELVQQNQELRESTSAHAGNYELEQQVQLLSNEKQTLQQQLLALQQYATSETPLQANATHNTDELSAQLQEKESEIVHLKQRIEDLMREDQTEKLVLEILTKNQEIHMLKMQVKQLGADKQDLEHNLTLQITKEMQDNKTMSDRESKLDSEHVKKLEKRVQELEDERKSMETELEVLNNHVMNSLELEDKMKSIVLELDMKNIEIAELRKSLETLKSNATINANTQNPPEVDFIALNAQWEAHVEQKCGEIAQMWREHLEQREKDFKTNESRLQEEILALQAASAGLPTQKLEQQQQEQVLSAETTATSSAAESTTASGSSSVAPSKEGTPLRRHHHIINEESEAEADAIIEKMQAALESQEMEIVTLKEQLAIRSAEYARLAAQYDPFKLQTTLSHSGMKTVSGPSSLDSAPVRRNASTGDNSVVPKSELDLALYMLHQRDMRCEEMTLELVSLLEERDTLQLKLSNTLRQVEAIKTQANYAEIPSTQAEAAAITSSDSPTRVTVAGSTAGDSSDELSQKLSQLQTVNHSKDKIIKEDRDQRIRQMERIQQDVAKMPSAAIGELVGSDLSQSNQSPSSVLLNWFWGNSNTSGGAPTS